MLPGKGSSRIDVAELKSQIVKTIGVERSNRYFYYLSRFLSQKTSKSEFHKLCNRVIGRENLALHNQFISSILKNACTAKTSPVAHEAGPAKSDTEDGQIYGSSHFTTLVPNDLLRSNGVSLPEDTSAVHDWKLKSKQCGLVLSNGKSDSGSHLSTATNDLNRKVVWENGDLANLDHARLAKHLQRPAQEARNRGAVTMRGTQSMKKSFDNLVALKGKKPTESVVAENGKEMEQADDPNFPLNPVTAPLGIPFCSASKGGACKAFSVTGNNHISFYNVGELLDIEVLRTRMQEIAAALGLDGVSMECANLLNYMLDVHLKRLIQSCVDLVRAKSEIETKTFSNPKQHNHSKILNGRRPSNHQHMQNRCEPGGVMQEQRPSCLVSVLDFKVAMELNPLQLGEDWPLIFEKICLRTFEVDE